MKLTVEIPDSVWQDALRAEQVTGIRLDVNKLFEERLLLFASQCRAVCLDETVKEELRQIKTGYLKRLNKKNCFVDVDNSHATAENFLHSRLKLLNEDFNLSLSVDFVKRYVADKISFLKKEKKGEGVK